MRNLLPDGDRLLGRLSSARVACHHSGVASVVTLDVSRLRKSLETDLEKTRRLWSLLAPRVIALSPDDLPIFQQLVYDELLAFCRICSLQMYTDGQVVDLSKGGVLVRGRLAVFEPADPDGLNGVLVGQLIGPEYIPPFDLE